MTEESIAQLEAEFEEHVRLRRTFEAAIWKYSLAVRHYQSGNMKAAEKAANECVQLASEIASHQLEDVVHQYTDVGGVAIPEYFHDDSVRSRFALIGIMS